MNANNSSLIPFNLSNEKLEDDNFVKRNNDSNEKEFFIEGFNNAKLIENYESDSDSDSDNEEKEENQESEENGDTIESFSNPLTKCPLTFGSKFSFAYTSASGNTSNCGRYGCRVAKVDSLYHGSPANFSHGGKHPQTFQMGYPHPRAPSPLPTPPSPPGTPSTHAQSFASLPHMGTSENQPVLHGQT